MDIAIKLSDFYFGYKKGGLVLKDINLEIRKGSFTVIVGPSGAGKTTLCKAMTGVVPFYSGGRYAGEVEVESESTKGKMVSDLAMKIGFIMEDYESQLVSMTAGEEIAFSLINHAFPPEEISARVSQALEDVGLPGRETYQLDELSGGQRQRLLLASVLAVHPDIIILDEPVSAMDPDGAYSLYQLIGKLHAQYGTTIVAVEHRVDYLLPFVTDMIGIKQGEIVTNADFATAARKLYADEEMRQLLPPLWQIKLGLEKKLNVDFGDWRSEAEAIQDFKTLKLEGRAD